MIFELFMDDDVLLCETEINASETVDRKNTLNINFCYVLCFLNQYDYTVVWYKNVPGTWVWGGCF